MASVFRSLMFLDCMLILLCSLRMGAEARKCPRSVMKEAKRCMRHIGSGNEHETILQMLMPGKNRTKQLCRDGTIQNAFACLNKLYSSCAKSKKGMRHLEMMVSDPKWRNAIDNICNSMPYLENFQECEAKAKVEFEPCARDARITFDQELLYLQSEIASMPRSQQQEAGKRKVDLVCSLSSKIMDCLRDPFERYCPSKMADILRNTFRDFVPPACAKRAMQRSVKYTVDGPHDGTGRGTPDRVKQDDGNNNRDDHRHRDGGYGVDEKDGDNTDNDKKVTSFDDEYNGGRKGVKGSNGRHGDRNKGYGKQNGRGDVVAFGSVAEVRGSKSGRKGGKGGNGGGGAGENGAPGGGATSTFVGGGGGFSGVLVMSLTAASTMMVVKML